MDITNTRLATHIILPAVMGLLVIAFYLSSLDNSFILDDLDAIVNNADVVESGGWQRLWRSDFWSGHHSRETAYRPVTVLSFWINAQVSGLSPIVFRLVNMALLGLLGWLVAAWLTRYVVYKTVAWLCAALFVAHPTHAEAINHIVGRADLLAMVGVVGFLLAQRFMLEAVIASRHDQQTSQFKKPYMAILTVLCLVCALVAMLSKETGLLLIPAAALQARAAHRRPRKGPPPSLGLLWPIHALAAACVTLPLAWFVWGYGLVHGLPLNTGGTATFSSTLDISANPLLGEGFAQRLPAAFSLAWFYARQLVMPAMTYSHTPANLPTMFDATTILGLLILVGLTAALTRAVYRRHWLALAAGLALGQWVLACHLWLPQGVYASNLMMMPFTLAAVIALSGALIRVTRGSMRKRTLAVLPTLAVILLMFWSVLGVNGRWFSTARLMAADLSVRSGNPVSMYNYGASQVRTGTYSSAVYWLDEAVDQRPHWIQARHLLALAYYSRGQFTEATHQYRRIAELSPEDLRARVRLIAMAIHDNDLDAAERHLDTAKRLSPHSLEVMLAEARVADATGNPALAREKYEAVLSQNPNHEQARRRRDELLKKLDRRQP